MTTAVLTYSGVQKRIRSRVSDITFPRINWKLVCFVIFFVCLSLLVYYVWQVRYLTSSTYLVSGYEQQIDKLLDEKKNIEVGFAESSFLGQVQQKVRDLNFQKATAVIYIQLPDTFLASAK